MRVRRSGGEDAEDDERQGVVEAAHQRDLRRALVHRLRPACAFPEGVREVLVPDREVGPLYDSLWRLPDSSLSVLPLGCLFAKYCFEGLLQEVLWDDFSITISQEQLKETVLHSTKAFPQTKALKTLNGWRNRKHFPHPQNPPVPAPISTHSPTCARFPLHSIALPPNPRSGQNRARMGNGTIHRSHFRGNPNPIRNRGGRFTRLISFELVILS